MMFSRFLGNCSTKKQFLGRTFWASKYYTMNLQLYLAFPWVLACSFPKRSRQSLISECSCGPTKVFFTQPHNFNELFCTTWPLLSETAPRPAKHTDAHRHVESRQITSLTAVISSLSLPSIDSLRWRGEKFPCLELLTLEWSRYLYHSAAYVVLWKCFWDIVVHFCTLIWSLIILLIACYSLCSWRAFKSTSSSFHRNAMKFNLNISITVPLNRFQLSVWRHF